ncbi:N-acyl-D-amino acid deacylase [Kitasatospora sp. MMS16-BH015]|uniref:N-acyl-D-amino-acid deacylase family protein n=1 Tax=Kitasatospora sp. MMS16-BH015 TaxID=2018025 RepID=UPI000CA10043|nr:D-aminoacylase [Kitasatospora sp. MMS16-BH015]AUG77012.1 N-acyl-D-amino acid deacylase [Kitasatospora sp. MMS16-BH015]
MQDLLIRGAWVVDGTGAPRRRADLGVTAGVITPPEGRARRVIEADGLVLAPGFIDMHAHSDLAVLTDPAHPAKVSQGVTCEVLGQDGLSYAPVDDSTLPLLRRQLAGWNGDPAGFDWSWRTVGQYLDRLDRDGLAAHACYLVPHGTLRALVVGWADRPAGAAELDRMGELLARGLREGAVGLSTGLTYTPGMYADRAELAHLCRVLAEHGAYHCPHTRSYGAGALEAYAEVIGLARETGCALHLTHATMNFGVNEGRAGEFLALVDAARADGVDLTLDSYPYLPGSTTLAALLPSWATAGGPAETLARLRDPAAREAIRVAVEETGSDGCHGVVTDWTTIQLSGSATAEVGCTIAELAQRGGVGGTTAVSGTTAFLDLLLADELRTMILQHVGHEANVRAIMRHPAHTVGSDGLLTGARPHPRAWGTFPRYLGHYSRELGVLSLEEAVARMTGRPARRLGLRGRGLIRTGYAADLVLFDPAAVRDTATFEHPRRPPEGIPYVLVAGTPVIDDHHPTEARPGRTLRRRTRGAVL